MVNLKQVLLLSVLMMFHFSIAMASKGRIAVGRKREPDIELQNPNRLARLALKEIKQGNLLQGLEYASRARLMKKLKPKLSREMVSLIQTNYESGLASSKVAIAKSMDHALTTEDSVYAFKKSLDILEKRSTILGNLSLSPVKIIESENESRLDSLIDDYRQSWRSQKRKAAEGFYTRGNEQLNKVPSTKTSAREAFGYFEKCLSFEPNYPDAKTKRDLALVRGQVHVNVQFINVGVGDSSVWGLKTDFQNHFKTKSATSWTIINYDRSTDDDLFIRIKLTETGVNFHLRPDEVHKLEKVVESDGEKVKVKARVVVSKKEAYSYVKADFTIHDKQQQLLFKSESIHMDSWWGSTWATASGDSRAITKGLKPYIGKEEYPFPKEQLLINDALMRLTDSFIPNLRAQIKIASQGL